LKIKDWPAEDRPREKFDQKGGYGLTDAELLAIIIGHGTKNATAFDLARELLIRCGSLRNLSEKTVTEVENLDLAGLGRTKAIAILAALELGRRSLLKPDLKSRKFNGPKEVYEHYGPLISHLKYELFKVAAVDGQNALLRDTTISKGLLDASLTHPREVYKFALAENAHGLFLIHNHPSGVKKPSDDDCRVTERLCRAGEIMGVRVIDHVILTRDGYYSFAEHDLI
jgi:DNA repair protein RadC